MLTIPDEIKNLLHLDTCRKNIRIHFPNGERSDICNDLIVMNTVSFTESLCSQDSLKFGLCEAPVFECETVGVGNIKGATIDVSCEVYCDASVSGAVWQMDLQAWVYPVQYGTFIVSECKRQADYIHRKIIAYGGSASYDWGLSFIEKQKGLLARTAAQTYQAKLFYFAMANLDPDTYSTGLFDETSAGINPSNLRQYVVTETWGWPHPLLVHGAHAQIRAVYYTPNLISPIPEAFAGELMIRFQSVKIADMDYNKERIRRTLINARADSSIQNEVTSFLSHVLLIGASNTDQPSKKITLSNNPDVLTYYANAALGSISNYWMIPAFLCTLEVKISGYGPHQTMDETIYVMQPSVASSVFGNAKIYKLKSTYTQMGAISRIFKTQATSGSGGYSLNYENIDILDTLSDLFETEGMFGSFMRNNTLNAIGIKQQFALLPNTTLYPSQTLYPGSPTGGVLLPNDYQSCWYDDEYYKPFGAVQCKYKDSGNNDNIYICYLTGFDESTDIDTYQVYDFSDNSIIQGNTWTSAQIQAICEEIAANIDGVTYMPVEFVGRGLPYVEAGDTFEILTKSNDSITTIVLNRTLKGEQVLTDSYKSV